MEPPQTCGRGLAEHSALPAKLAELTGAVAAILEHHMEIAAPAGADAFEELVKREQELVTLLENRLEQHRPMLAGMRAVASSPR